MCGAGGAAGRGAGKKMGRRQAGNHAPCAAGHCEPARQCRAILWARSDSIHTLALCHQCLAKRVYTLSRREGTSAACSSNNSALTPPAGPAPAETCCPSAGTAAGPARATALQVSPLPPPASATPPPRPVPPLTAAWRRRRRGPWPAPPPPLLSPSPWSAAPAASSPAQAAGGRAAQFTGGSSLGLRV